MRYQFAFIQNDLVPIEHKDRDLQRWKQQGIHELVEKMMADYNYQTDILPNGQEKHTIELIVMNSQKYGEAIVSVGRLLIYHPELRREVLQVLREADMPDNNSEQYFEQ